MVSLFKADLEAVLSVSSYCLKSVSVKKDSLDFDIVDKVFYFSIGQRSIHRDYNGSHVDDTHVGDCPFGTVLTCDGYTVALSDSLLIEPAGNFVELGSGLFVCEDHMLRREGLKASVVRKALCVDVEHLSQGRPFGIKIFTTVLIQIPPGHRIETAFSHFCPLTAF